MWFIRQRGSAAPVSQPSTTVEKFPSLNECSFNKSEHGPLVVVSRVPPKTKRNASPDWHLVSFCLGFRQRVWSMLLLAARDVVCRTRDSQHGDSLTDARTEIASAIELSLKLESRVVELTAGRDVKEKCVCLWPIFGDRWIMAAPDGTLVDVPFNHLVGTEGCHWKANISKVGSTNQVELPVRDDDLRNSASETRGRCCDLQSRESS